MAPARNHTQTSSEASKRRCTRKVQVAAGDYAENIVLKNGIALLEAGRADTILDPFSNGTGRGSC